MLLVNPQAKSPCRVHLRKWMLLVLVTCCCAADLTSYGMGADTRILLVVLDGFRSDYFTPELMPRCYAAAQKGVIGKAHHAMLPTVTRVNAATLVTGCFPAHHGLVANTLYVPSLNPSGGISTGSRKRLLAVTEVWGGRLLAVPTLPELLAEHGQSFLACSSGSSGSATLLNPTGAGAGILHPEFCVPDNQTRHMYEMAGPKPPETEPARELMRWMTDAYLKIGVPEHDPRVTVLWFTDPDHTAHAKGVGAPKTVEGIHIADEQLGRIFDFQRERGMKVNVFIVADHGFATYSGRFNVARSLEAKGWMQRAKPVVIEGAIYLSPEHETDLAEIVRVLQEDASVGPILTAARLRGAGKEPRPGPCRRPSPVAAIHTALRLWRTQIGRPRLTPRAIPARWKRPAAPATEQLLPGRSGGCLPRSGRTSRRASAARLQVRMPISPPRSRF